MIKWSAQSVWTLMTTIIIYKLKLIGLKLPVSFRNRIRRYIQNEYKKLFAEESIRNPRFARSSVIHNHLKGANFLS